MDEKTLKASIQTGPKVGSLDSDKILIDRLLQVQENLHTVVLQLKEKTLEQAAATVNNLTPSSPKDAENALLQTRDLGKKLHDALEDSLHDNKRSIQEIFNDHFKNLETFVQESGKFVDKFIESHHNDVMHFFAPYKSGLSGMAAEALHVRDSSGKQVVSNVATQAISVAESFGSFIPSLLGLSGAVTGFIGALSGATVALGMFSAFSAMRDQEKFNATMLRAAPMAADHLRDTQHTSLNQMRLDLNSVLATNRSKEELDKLYQAAFETRPGAGVDFQQMSDVAATFGILEDRGLSVDKSKGFATTMREELRMSYGETIGAMMELSTTAVTHRYDIGSYIDKIVQLSKSVRYQGTTITDVNRIVNNWAGTTLANGMILTPDNAITAAQMQLNLRRSLTEGEAAYVVLNNPDLHAKTGEGLYGSDHSLGELSKLGPLGMKQAALQMRIGNVTGGQEAVVKFHNEMVDTLMDAVGAKSSGLNANEMKNLRYTMMASELGVDEKYGIDAGVTAFVQKLANKEILSEKEFKKGMTDITAKPMDKLYQELKEHYPTMINELYEKQKDHKNMLLSWQQIWVDIQNMLGTVFLPMVEVISSGISAIGTYLITGDVGKASDQFHLMQSIFTHENQASMANLFEGRSGLAEALGVWPHPTTVAPHDAWGDMTRFFTGGHDKDADHYLATIVKTAREFQIDPALLMGQIDTESGFKWNAVSSAGARGLGQLTKPAISDIASHYHYSVNPDNPESNIRGTAMYLRMKLEKYTNMGYDKQTAIKLALMAYNGGEGTVDRFIAHGGHMEDLPTETRLYPAKVLANTANWRNKKMQALGDEAARGSLWSPDVPMYNVEAISTVDIHLHDPNTQSKFKGRTINKKSLNYGVGR